MNITKALRLQRGVQKNLQEQLELGKLSPNWLDLPQEVTAAILQKLGTVDILQNVQRVCTQWRSICKEPLMWRTIDMGNMGDLRRARGDLETMCMHAVDRSCGGLVDLDIRYFGTNELVDYVTQRCTQIRRLRLVLSYGVTEDEGICEVAERLPLLEDLEISYCDVTAKALQKVGECCPLLKSLKINQRGFRDPPTGDGDAMAIAKHMPSLHHLQLFGNWLTNKGLEAILDGCPNLESLDLRQCFNIDLEKSSSLGKRCERIKDFRKPLDSTDDYEFDVTLEEYPYSDSDEGSGGDDD